jgi:aldehyde:ferredoxin oxidoreductase
MPRPVNRFAETENADIVIANQNGTAMGEVGIVCSFARAWGWFPQVYGKLLAASTGVDRFAEIGNLAKTGERIVNLERAFNAREGFGRRDDTLPSRMLNEPLHTYDAPGEGEMVREREKFLDRYYELRGWSAQGVPTAAKLKELGLEEITSDLPGR